MGGKQEHCGSEGTEIDFCIPGVVGKAFETYWTRYNLYYYRVKASSISQSTVQMIEDNLLLTSQGDYVLNGACHDDRAKGPLSWWRKWLRVTWRNHYGAHHYLFTMFSLLHWVVFYGGVYCTRMCTGYSYWYERDALLNVKVLYPNDNGDHSQLTT